ncbi:hypothetical protein [Noviluteimonas gilva]|uniref:Uncharacterized protein n=1 Tax=Noviluteimonas gilva TaxID=2682097 RepID=A0A7C9HL85_9GAMM|nr:hypothetical protein [Lysobacter gilvus]MUV13537.1 hypothetical protein [Lysobacter gilvus]
MSRETYLAAAEELGLANDPLIRDVMSLLYAANEAELKRYAEETARIGRMHRALGDEPPAMACGERRARK